MAIDAPTDETFASDTVVGVERDIVDYLKEQMPNIMANIHSEDNDDRTIFFKQKKDTNTVGDFALGFHYGNTTLSISAMHCENDPLLGGVSWVTGGSASVDIPSGITSKNYTDYSAMYDELTDITQISFVSRHTQNDHDYMVSFNGIKYSVASGVYTFIGSGSAMRDDGVSYILTRANLNSNNTTFEFFTDVFESVEESNITFGEPTTITAVGIQ